MIIVKLIGGLGNQLFQYSAGLHLSIIHKTSLKLDTFPFIQYKLHKYSLQHFNISSGIASVQEIERFPLLPLTGIKKLNRKIKQTLNPFIVLKEDNYNLNFDESVFNKGKNIYIDGYWQTEKYFKKIESLIRSEFSLKIPMSEQSNRIMQQMQNCNAVSIHVRRADYVTNSSTFQILGACGIDYYLKAINTIAEKISNPVFYVFSDDFKWTKENLKIDFPCIFVDFNNPDTNYEDLTLMSKCKHHIIANSTFSWWGAWLNPNPDKIIIAPAKWFNDPKYINNDIIPDSWLKI